jgi:hypothetical protein
MARLSLRKLFGFEDRVAKRQELRTRFRPRVLQMEDRVVPATTWYVNAAYAGSEDGSSTQPFNTIQEGVNAAAPGDTVQVAPGTYNEDIFLHAKPGLAVIGAGPASTTISGVLGGSSDTVLVGQNNVIEGFTITRATGAGENNFGVVVATGTSGSVIRNNVITGNRSAIYLNGGNSQGTITRNVIDGNRTGVILPDASGYGAYQITENAITNNKTFGVLFNAVGPIASGLVITNNNISGNWASQLENNSGAAVNASGNWWGTPSPTAYAGSVNALLGADPGTWSYPGPAVQPGSPFPYILSGTAAAQIDYTPYLNSGADTAATPGFQGDFSNLTVTPAGAQTGTTGRIQEGVNRVTPGGTVNVESGTYVEAVTISKSVTIDGAGNGPSPVAILRPPAAGANTIEVTTTTATDDVTILDMAFDGLANTGRAGVFVGAAANFDTLTVDRSTFTGFQFWGVGLIGNQVGDTVTPVSVNNVVLSNSTFSENGINQGGAGAINLFGYNGNATLTNIDVTNTGNDARLGIQLRGVGFGTGVGVFPMGTVSLNDVAVSGTYRNQFIGIQRYSDVSNLSFTDVGLGGSTSELYGTFGALLRFDAVGTGTVSSPATVNLGNTHFRGLAGSPAVPFSLEFAPDNTFAFLRADATGTRWDVTPGSDTPAGALTLSQLFQVEDRILHYVEPNHPSGQPFKGFAEVQDGNAYVTATYGSLIQRAVEMVDVGGTVNVAAGTYNQDVSVAKAVTVRGANAGVAAGVEAGARGPESIVDGGFLVQADDVTLDGFTILDGAAVFNDGPAGVYLAGGVSDVLIQNNILTGDDAGRGILSTFNGDNDDITIHGNDIGHWTTGVLNQGNTNVDVLCNTIHDNVAGVANDFVTDVLVKANDFKGNGEAVGTFSSTGVVVQGNDLDGNTDGVNNYDGDAVDARFNWWGTPAGPASGYNSGAVTVAPWLFASALTSTSNLVFAGPNGASLVVNTATGQYTFADGTNVYSGTGARIQNGVLKIHDQSSFGKIDVTESPDGTITVSLKGKGAPRTFTLEAVDLDCDV